MITGQTTPSRWMGAYSAIPLKFKDDNFDDFQRFQYVTNIVWDAATATGATNVQFNGQVQAQFNFALNHTFEVGDKILIDDFNLNLYTGYYNILATPTLKSVVVDTQLQSNVTADIFLHKVKRYKQSPDLQGEAKVDLSSTLRDFVTQNLEDVNEIFAGTDTAFRYDLYLGSESVFVYDFDDNYFLSGGSVGFINTSLTATTQVPFNIGDEIIVEQELYDWNYSYAFNSGGNLAFYSSGATQNFASGQTVEVFGQPLSYYNGTTGILSVPNGNTIVTNKLWIQNVAATAGNIFGTPRPTYNTTSIITDIFIDGGLVIGTNIPYAGSSQAIPGSIKLLSGEKSISPAEYKIYNYSAYNARVENLDYRFNLEYFEDYTIRNQMSAWTTSQASTILNSGVQSAKTTTEHYRIRPESKSWLLVHCQLNDVGANAGYDWYDSSGNILGTSYIFNMSLDKQDCYFPVGLNQILASANRTDAMVNTANTLSTIYSQIDSYSVWSIVTDKELNKCSREIFYQIDETCSQYPIHHLMWKDSYGSWLSFPFSMITEKRIESDKSDYYKSEGQYKEDDTFGYETFERGQTTYFSRNRNKYVLNSDWVNDVDNTMIEDLIKSASVYMQKPDGVLVAVRIVDRDLQIKNGLNDMIFNYRLEVTEANNDLRF